MTECHGTHRFFVADCAIVKDEGTVNVIVVCTSCGENQITRHKVAQEGANITLEKFKGN